MKKQTFKMTLHNKNGEVIHTLVSARDLLGASFEFIEAMSKGNKSIAKVVIERK